MSFSFIWTILGLYTLVNGRKNPNIIIMISDDQDVALGSMKFMPKLQKCLTNEGMTFSNAFVTTPMCCPSRSSMLTGLYVHNHHVYTNSGNCSSIQWRAQFESRTFGAYLHDAGYRTGYFGKYLNEYNADYIPPGWDDWVVLKRNTRYYNYSLNVNGKMRFHGNNYARDYFTDLIANETVRFLHESKRDHSDSPFLAVLSFPAPHGTEDAAPQYQGNFEGSNYWTHRTPSWDIAPNPDKQWLLQFTPRMLPYYRDFTDLLHRKRLQTLLSVDDAVDKVVQELNVLGLLENTYMIYTSDHGYHLGQFGLIKGKSLPYEFDIRVPFVVRGPGVNRNAMSSGIVLNIDIAPTILDLAGISPPDDMDGASFSRLLHSGNSSIRETFLIERGKLTKRKLRYRERLEAERNNLLTKRVRVQDECSERKLRRPCLYGQEWYCSPRADGLGLRKRKCRRHTETMYAARQNFRKRVRNNGASSRQQKKRFRGRNLFCKQSHMNCFLHDRKHWRTPPLWEGPPICFCTNSNNNTYWCVRTINTTHNYLYCEYITGFMSYYDLNADPNQLKNIIKSVQFVVRTQLHDLLMKLRRCRGRRECTGTPQEELEPDLESELSAVNDGSHRDKKRRYSYSRWLQNPPFSQ